MKEGNAAWQALADDDKPLPKIRVRRFTPKGTCYDCKKPSLPNRTYCQKHLDKMRERCVPAMKKLRLKRRMG